MNTPPQGICSRNSDFFNLRHVPDYLHWGCLCLCGGSVGVVVEAIADVVVVTVAQDSAGGSHGGTALTAAA